MKLKKLFALGIVSVLAAMLIWTPETLMTPAKAGGKVKAQKLPKGALGFAGMIRGVVKGKTKSGFIFWVGKIKETWKNSKASDPESLIGKLVLIVPRREKGEKGKWHYSERHIKFIRLLETGDEITIDVASYPDRIGNKCLMLLELTKEQREHVEKGIGFSGEEEEEEEKAHEEEEKEEREKKRDHEEKEEERERKKAREREEREERKGREREEREEEEAREREEREERKAREREEREERKRRHEEEKEERERKRDHEEEEEERSKDREQDEECEFDGLPDGMHGFSGILKGKVVGKIRNGFVLLVTDVVRLWKNNEAENPESAVGKRLPILAQWRESDNGKWHPDEIHLRFIKGLDIGAVIKIEVVNDEGERLHILELSREQRKK
ncbi:MAG: hypothetical protein E3J72_20955 [Planctomycetota bacterium]|nr:MAG: hypothetical protein E3J72_20955 [Planctomycetota bacterium]